MHSTASTSRRRTAVICKMRSGTDSGRAASPTVPIALSSKTRSGRLGGSGRIVRCAISTIANLRGKRGLDLVGKQQIVDAAMQLFEFRRADVLEAEMIGIQLRLHAARMRREHQDAAADQDRFLDRMRDEQHREADIV